jgi:hypothetical protein
MPAILTAGKFKTKNYTILGESAGEYWNHRLAFEGEVGCLEDIDRKNVKYCLTYATTVYRCSHSSIA